MPTTTAATPVVVLDRAERDLIREEVISRTADFGDPPLCALLATDRREPDVEAARKSRRLYEMWFALLDDLGWHDDDDDREEFSIVSPRPDGFAAWVAARAVECEECAGYEAANIELLKAGNTGRLIPGLDLDGSIDAYRERIAELRTEAAAYAAIAARLGPDDDHREEA